MAQQLSAEEFSRLQSQLIELRTENYQLREKGSKLETEVGSLRSKVSTQDREIQLKRVTSLLPIGKNSKKQKQDYEATLGENDTLHRKVEVLEEDHRKQQQMLMLELSNVHDQLEQIRTERDRLLGVPTSSTSSAGAVATAAATTAAEEDSRLRHLQAENAVLQKTLASTRESMQQQAQLRGADSADGAGASLSTASDESDARPPSADLQMKLDTAQEEKRMLEERLKQQTARHEEALCKAQEESAKWSDKARKKQDSLRQMQDEKDALIRDKESTVAALGKSHDDELQRVMFQSARMQEELGNANEELHSLRDLEGSLRSQVSLSADNASRAEDELKLTTDSLRQDVARLQEELGSSNSLKVQVVKGQVEELESSVKDLQGKVYEAERERNQAIEERDEANKVADKRKALVDALAIEKQSHADEVHLKLTEQSAAYEARLEGAALQITDLKADVLRLGQFEDELKSFGSVRTKLAHEEEQRVRLEKELKSQRESLAADINRLEAELATVNGSLESKDKDIDEMQQAVADAEGKIKIADRKSHSLMKDIRRQLELERKRSERLQNALCSDSGTPVGLAAASTSSTAASGGGTPEVQKKGRRFEDLFDGLASESGSGGGFSLRHRTNSNDTLSNSGESASAAGSEDVGSLLARITALQKDKWMLEERVCHLETNAASLVEDVLQKSAIIKCHMMEPKADQQPTAVEEAASRTPTAAAGVGPRFMRKLTSPLLRGLGDAHSASTAASTETLRLQRLVEETLIKNLSLRQNVDMLSSELSRVQQEKEVLEEKLVQD